MEATAEGDDPGASGHPPGELERAVDRLGARVEEHDRVERSPGRSPPGRWPAREIGAVKPIALIGPMSRSTWAWIAAVTRGWRMAERRDRDAVREVEVRPAVRVVQPMPFAVAPVAHEVAAEDGRQVRGGRPSAGRVPRRVLAAPDAPARPGPAAYDAGDGRLHPDRREPARAAERPGLRRGGDPAVHPRVGREGRGPSRGVRQDGRAGLPGRADPRGVRRRRDGLHQLRASCARSWSVPTPRSVSSRASTSGSTRWRSCSGGPRSSASAGSSRRPAARSSRRSG